MLSRTHCRHTGIVNFFAAADPLLAIGSVIKAGEPGRYCWRYYLGREPACGIAVDMRTAENHLVSSHRVHLQAPVNAGDELRVSERHAASALRAASGSR